MGYLTKILLVTVCLIALSGVAACHVVECKSPGYWKSHPDAWPVQSVTIGDITYLKSDAIAIMKQPVEEDKSYIMFNALVAAKLNQANGCNPSSDVVNTIRGANRWMKIYKLGDNIEASSDAWQKEFVFFTMTYPSGKVMYEKLNAFNNDYKSPSYWINHPDAWPVQSVTIGDITYLKSDAIAIMKQPVEEDKSYIMFNALVAAKLNQANGCNPSSDVVNTIRGANRWMKIYKLGDNIEASSDAWQKEFVFFTMTYPSGKVMYEKLDAFNNDY